MKKRKLNKKNVFLAIVIVISLIMLIFSGIKIIKYIINNNENKEIQELLIEETINIIKQDPESTENNEEITYEVDFATLKKKNKDAIAYLKVYGTKIDNIVVRGSDNDYYLDHNFNRDYNTAGWLFADYHNKFDESDYNIIIYGHNMRDGSMFGTLHNVLYNDWQQNEENLRIVLVTENKTYYYQTFSTYTIKVEDYYINTEFSSDDEFKTFITKLKARSEHNFNVSVSGSDRILTLSTCTSNGTKRVVLHAKLIQE